MKFAYITDSGTGKSMSYFAEMNIISLPLQITDGKSTFQDMENMSTEQCIQALREEKILMTSQPSPGLIEECFRSLKDQGVELIVAVPICNGLSGTIGTMTAIAEQLDLKIICIDTYTTAVVQEYLIRRMKEMYEQNADQLAISLMIEEVVSSCETIVIPKDLVALSRGGRLTPLAAHLAQLLRIVPILHLGKETGGRIDLLDKTLTFRRAMNTTVEYMKKWPINGNWRIAVAHTNNEKDAAAFRDRIAEAFPDAKIEIIPLCNVVSAQAGMGCLGIQWFKEC